ncbi:tripartite tricarboxylate transporter substrate binding protein [Bacillus horti]|uniref:Tripartite-type tricarboxylate transporter receptor subunit TctC n=1 Tax=Caldalkalibacillus horti TaxID=77523 RepID=A0ABT9VTQ3_9BACI|nr:tripartite tricarboxylate transporter substrate binding protein [Bacillus horti]MDQ0164365.1 tripartite-type tricarboxylate transporter receptor subunit TctC [Bacillus horti]
MWSKKVSVFLIILLVSLTALGCASGSSSDGSQGDDSNGEKKAITKWPSDRVTMILPFDAGGSLDRMMRTLSQHLENELDTKITIDNRPGAATQVGTTMFMNSADDGSFFFGGTQLYLSASIILQTADYDIDDFAMVNIEQFDPVVITVHKDSPIQTFEQLIEMAKNNPGKLSYSTVSGGPLHLTGVLLEDALDIKLNPIFYDGGGEMRNALLGKHVDFMIGNALGDSAIADQVRVLAVSAEEKMDLWPDSPTINDELKEYSVEIPQVGSVRFIGVHRTFKEKHPELFNHLVDAYESVYYSDEYQQFIEESNAVEVSEFRGPEKSDTLNKELHELLMKYKDEMSGN